MIELIVIITVLGLSIPVLLTMWADVAWRSARWESLADANFYAQQLMEEIKSKEFVDPDDAANTVLGPNGTESYPNYNDVDDFNGYSDIQDSKYSRCVTVDYVSLPSNVWVGTCNPAQPVSCTVPVCAPANATDFKRIIIRVRRTDSIAQTVTLTTIVAKH